MLMLLLYILLFSSNVFGEQEFSSTTENECNSEILSWTRWFNTQDPTTINNGNDIEDISTIRNLYPEAVRCSTVLNVEYSVTGKSNNEVSFYQKLINNNGVFCMGSSTSCCPDYNIYFCCLLEQISDSQQCGKTFYQPRLASVLRIANGSAVMLHLKF